MAYLEMATVYDLLMKDAPYQEWTKFTAEKIKENKVSASSIIDLGCGTGTITRQLAEEGYTMIGVDNSESMLTIAQNRAMEEGKSIHWVLQDIRALEGFSEIDVAVSFCDVINYITEPEEVNRVFMSTNKALRKNGLFLFDVHSLHHIEENLQGQTFAEIYDDLSYIWLCDPGEHPGEVYHDLTFFIREKELFQRFDETHHQRTFAIEFYEKLLGQNGFKILSLHGDFSLQPGIGEHTNRILFVAEKIEEVN